MVSEKEMCQLCKVGVMNLKAGKFGSFMGCSKFPECKNTYAPDYAKLRNKAIHDMSYKKEHRERIGNTYKG